MLCSNLLENGGFACVRQNMVRVRGGPKTAPSVAGGVKSGLKDAMGVLRSPMPYSSRCGPSYSVGYLGLFTRSEKHP